MLSMQTFILKVSEFSYNVLVDNPQKHFAMPWMKMWIPISCLINIYVFLPSVESSEDPICNLNFETFASQFLSQKVWYTYWYTLSLWFWIWYENELIIFIMNDSGLSKDILVLMDFLIIRLLYENMNHCVLVFLCLLWPKNCILQVNIFLTNHSYQLKNY